MDSKNMVLWKDRKHHLWFPISFTKYSIENDRLMITEGFFSTTINETLLYRIVDLTLRRTLAHRLFGTGDILIQAKVDSTPEIILKNIAKPLQVRNLISQAVEDDRAEKEAGGLLANRLNDLRDEIKKLTDELERKVSIEELAVYMDMPAEEIENLLKLAGEAPEGGEEKEE